MKPNFSFLVSNFPFCVCGFPFGFCQATSFQAQNEFSYACLEPDELYIKSQLLQSDVTRYDETGYYVGQNWSWEHVASVDLYTYVYKYPRNLFDRLSKYQGSETTFAHNAEVPFFAQQVGRDLTFQVRSKRRAMAASAPRT